MLFLIFTSCCIMMLLFVFMFNRDYKIKNYSNKKFIHDLPKHLGPNYRDRYSTKKIPKDIDVIIIGSGIGGLTCGGLLSKVGKRVLVLEQHYIAGGCTHNFVEHGYEFDTGLHYMGNIEKRAQILDLITEEKIEWDKMGSKENGYIYDEISIGKPEKDGSINYIKYDLPAGREAFISMLVSKFPEEKNNIIKYLDLVEQTSQKNIFFNLKIIQSKWLSKLLNYVMSHYFFRTKYQTALEVVSQLTTNTDLISVLLGQFGDYGRLPSEESFFIHASVVQHYLNGGYYPRQGSSVFAKQIIPTIEKTGGRCLVGKKVSKILINNGKIYGVEMETGDIIESPIVISACGIQNTYKKLLPKEHIPKNILQKIDKIGYSCSMVYLFVGLNGDSEELQLRSSNIWHLPNKNYDNMLRDFNNDYENAPIPLFIGFPSAKDSTWKDRYPGKSNAVILTMCNYEIFSKWENTPQGKRGLEYENIKKIFEKRILEGLFYYYPNLKDKIDFTMVGTPVTFNHYIGSLKGEVYGMKSSPERYNQDDWLTPKTNIPGFYLTGQDITTLGITGAMMGGVLTAHSVLGYGSIIDLLTNRNLIKDMINSQKA